MLRTLLKLMDGELSRIRYGHTLGLWCEWQGQPGNRVLNASTTACAKALRSEGYFSLPSKLTAQNIELLVGILNRLERQRDAGVVDPKVAWAAPYLVAKEETLRLNLPPEGLPDDLVSIVQQAAALLSSALGTDPQVIGITVYRNRATRDQRLISADWHFDRRPTDWLRYFVYLSDVDLDSGPFHFIDLPNSRHITRQGFRRQSGSWQSKVEVSPDIQQLLGKAGSGLVINVERLLHRAGVPEPGRHRDMLEIIFKPRAN